MAWIKKSRTMRRYYYRSRRVGDKVVKEYLGRGGEAESAAVQDAAARAERFERHCAERAAEAELVGTAQTLGRFGALVGELYRAILILSGYHMHHGEWRRRNEQAGEFQDQERGAHSCEPRPPKGSIGRTA